MPRGKFQRPFKRRCNICERLADAETLTYARYERGDREHVGGGIVCADCLSYLPDIVVAPDGVWDLVLRAV